MQPAGKHRFAKTVKEEYEIKEESEKRTGTNATEEDLKEPIRKNVRLLTDKMDRHRSVIIFGGKRKKNIKARIDTRNKAEDK